MLLEECSRSKKLNIPDIHLKQQCLRCFPILTKPRLQPLTPTPILEFLIVHLIKAHVEQPQKPQSVQAEKTESGTQLKKSVDKKPRVRDQLTYSPPLLNGLPVAPCTPQPPPPPKLPRNGATHADPMGAGARVTAQSGLSVVRLAELCCRRVKGYPDCTKLMLEPCQTMHSALKADKRSAGLTSALLTRALAVRAADVVLFPKAFVIRRGLDKGGVADSSSDECSHVGMTWRVLWFVDESACGGLIADRRYQAFRCAQVLDGAWTKQCEAFQPPTWTAWLPPKFGMPTRR